MNLSLPRFLRYFDWLNFGIMLTLTLCGLAAIYSATFKTDAPYSIFFKKQVIGSLIGFIIYGIAAFIDYRTICRWGFYLYFGVIGLLILTIIKGSIGMGAQRWINLFFFKVQPSELVKLFFPAFFSHFFIVIDEKKPPLSLIIFAFFILIITTLLVLKQPDLGTALILLFCGLILFWLTGTSAKFFIILAFSIAVIIPLGWKNLKPYQKKRIEVFLGQGSSHSERYQTEQSIIAIGSGSITGKGFLKGTQNTFRFLPEGRTDFVFAVICEEWGFIGGSIILLLFGILFMRLFYLISTLKSNLAATFACGLTLPLVISTLINLGMVIGLLPIVGIPLPLVSYGLSHLWISFISLGILNNIAIRRFYH